MVLPSDYHWALRGWLRLRGVEAGEAAGILIVGNLDGLLAVSGASRRLDSAEHDLVSSSRATGHDRPFEQRLECRPRSSDLQARVEALLAEVCQALCDAGIRASPFDGLGVCCGDEIFEARVCVEDTTRLYQLMALDGFVAKPDWDAPPFRERAWPEA